MKLQGVRKVHNVARDSLLTGASDFGPLALHPFGARLPEKKVQESDLYHCNSL